MCVQHSSGDSLFIITLCIKPGKLINWSFHCLHHLQVNFIKTSINMSLSETFNCITKQWIEIFVLFFTGSRAREIVTLYPCLSFQMWYLGIILIHTFRNHTKDLRTTGIITFFNDSLSCSCTASIVPNNRKQNKWV